MYPKKTIFIIIILILIKTTKRVTSMTEIEPIELQIELSAEDSNDEDLDRITRALIGELRETNVEAVSMVRQESTPSGTKSGGMEVVGIIAVAVLPKALEITLDLIVAWAKRKQGRNIKVITRMEGKVFEVEGSLEEVEKALAQLAKRKKGK